MRIVATADLHGYLPEIPKCDLLLIAGDICPVWNHDRKYQADWLRSTFSEWLEESPADEVIWTGGNHDFVLQDMSEKKRNAIPGYYLMNDYLVVNGFKIWGSPYSPTFGKWAFMEEDFILANFWKEIPDDTNVLMVHGPAYGYCDQTLGWMGSPPENVGSRSLRERTLDLPDLKLVVSGHIHPGYGKTEDLRGVKFANVSYVNEEYNPVNPPMVFDL